MGDTGVRRTIVEELSAMYPGLYTNENIAFVGTHQVSSSIKIYRPYILRDMKHSGVGGYLENLLVQLTSLGYVNQTATAIIKGTVRAVQRAHDSLKTGRLSLGNTTVLNANINRSPSAYLANPEKERALYEYDQDKELTLLRFDDDKGNARGFLSFFPVHGTSLYEVNNLLDILDMLDPCCTI
jgi:neutral ceramidase